MAKLSQQDWIYAGLEALDMSGIAGVKVERIASALGVSKGSFYWHFKNRDALILAMLNFWEEQATQKIIELVDSSSALPKERLIHLCQICFRPHRFDAAEANWRLASIENPDIAKTCKRVDKKRIKYVQDLLEGIGLSKSVAKTRAHFMYLMLVGNTTWIQIGGRKLSPIDLEEFIEMLTG